MIKLNESTSYDVDVNGYETGEVVQGGQNGVANRPLKALANRTNWLKSAYDAIVLTLQGINTVLSGLKSASTYEATANKIDGKIPLWDSVYSKAEVTQMINDALSSIRGIIARGTEIVGNIASGNGTERTIYFPSVGSTDYTVAGSVVSIPAQGCTVQNDVYITWGVRSKTLTSCVIHFQEIGAVGQNINFDWAIITK